MHSDFDVTEEDGKESETDSEQKDSDDSDEMQTMENIMKTETIF